jgi:hypothetical protein
MGVRINRGKFRSRDSHAVASRGLGRVERRVGLLKKPFQREKPHSWLTKSPRLIVIGTAPLGVCTGRTCFFKGITFYLGGLEHGLHKWRGNQ